MVSLSSRTISGNRQNSLLSPRDVRVALIFSVSVTVLTLSHFSSTSDFGSPSTTSLALWTDVSEENFHSLGNDGEQMRHLKSSTHGSGSSPLFQGRARPSSLIRHDRTVRRTNSSSTVPPFIEKHCDLTGVDTWMPTNSSDWRLRTPAMMVLGTKKAGTTALFATLAAHPRIIRARAKELQFFIPKRFQFYTDGIGSPVKVKEAREFMWTNDYPVRKLRKAQNSHLLTLDATPEYFTYPLYGGAPIFCTVPWVKLLVIIREPIKRLFSHYNFITDPTKHNTSLPPFDVWVRHDIRRLQKFGVLPKNLSQVTEYMGTPEELEGFHAYQKTTDPRSDRQVIRSLYALQLEEWFDVMRQVGKDPAREFRVVVNEEFSESTTAANDLYTWIFGETSSDGTLEPTATKRRMITKYTSPPMKNTTRALLNKIYAPHNQRLYHLLGPEYHGIFDFAQTDPN